MNTLTMETQSSNTYKTNFKEDVHMPYLQVTTNVPINRKQKVLIDEAIAKSLVIVPKERPEFLMTNFEDASSMFLSADPKPCAMVQLRVVQKVYDDNADLFETLMAVITEVVSKVLDIEKDRIYAVCTGTNIWTAAGADVMKTILK